MHCTFLSLGLVAAIMVGSSSGAVHHYRIPISDTSDRADNRPLKGPISAVSGLYNTGGPGSLNGVLSGIFGANTQNKGAIEGAVSGVFPRDKNDKTAIRRRSLLHRRKQEYAPLQRRFEEVNGNEEDEDGTEEEDDNEEADA